MFSKKFLIDLVERSVWTFVQGFAAVVIVQGHFGVDALKLGAVAGGLSVLKSILAYNVGAEDAALPSNHEVG